MTTVQTKRIQPGYEPIEGYVLEKRIGRGGYGEVWRAEAPGGLKKAVKFVFGQQDERRAEQELKSLERIKGIQHPFILTLERFELIDNQLVIVTELADGSLEDIYKQHQARGSCGIPREALLGYMKDAADALDYLHQLYKLQHLDIKPGNLLMVGGRVKVADFGLLKDLGEVECSLVGGLTPIYAPPEVFDGRPSIHSDQYSLAVMYQELLTSTRPFSGRTIAQLATQHVHNAPNLNPLPASDRPCVARALEKSPERRFSSCSEFVEKLVRPHGTQAVVSQVEKPRQESPAHKVENLPQVCGIGGIRSETSPAQTLVVALGGTGADCLNELRSRINEYGAATPMVMHSVLIDTNPVTTQTAAMIDGSEFIPACHVVDAKLRTPNEYRSGGTERLKTISRRWIYNVPRNGQTGGMRPLGRLALVDHGDQVLRTLRAAVEELKHGQVDGGDVKIYVVGSLTGGTGSGMYIDVVYLLRHLLDESAMENEPILSFLTTNKFQGDPSRPLALHATKSAIKELEHFLKPGNSYPGDIGAGWPSVPAARTPLHNAYVVAQSDRPGAPTALDSVVNYLWSDATLCGDWFTSGRGDHDDSTIGQPSVRTLNVVQIGDPAERQSNLLAPYPTKMLLLRWLGNPRDSKSAATELSSRMIRRCYLDAEALCRHTETWLGDDRQTRRSRLIEYLKTLDPDLLKSRSAIRSRLAKWLTSSIDLDQTDVIVGQIIGQIEREIGMRLHDGRLDLSSTITGLTAIGEHARQLHLNLVQTSEDELLRLETVADVQPQPPNDAGGDVQRTPLVTLSNACMLGEQLIGIIATRAAASVATALDDKLSDMVEVYADASARIAQAIKKLNDDDCRATEHWSSLDESIRGQLPTLLDQMHDECVASHLFKIVRANTPNAADALTSELTNTASGLIRTLIESSNSSIGLNLRPGNTSSVVGAETRSSISKSNDAVSIDKTTLLNQIPDSLGMTQTHCWSESSVSHSLNAQAALEAVRPPLLECGGKQRLYLVCRNKLEQQTLQAQLQNTEDLEITTILARSSMPMFVHEAQDIQLKNILAWLDALTGDDGRICDRLATRCDVQWG